MEKYTISEIKALSLLIDNGIIPLTTHGTKDAHWAGNYIIELAEKIKAERAILAIKI